MSRSGNDLVLVVEDNDIDAELLHRAFQRLKPKVILRRCEDGITALEALKTCRPDLIIMDIRMPRMGGLEALNLIKEDEDWRSIPVIMMSSSKCERDIADSYFYRANAYIVKAFDARDDGTIEALVRFWLETVELNMLTTQRLTGSS